MGFRSLQLTHCQGHELCIRVIPTSADGSEAQPYIQQTSLPLYRARLRHVAQYDASASATMHYIEFKQRSRCVSVLGWSCRSKLSPHEPCQVGMYPTALPQTSLDRGWLKFDALLCFRVGQELSKRGHTFSVLVSDQDIISRRVLQSRAFPGMQVTLFAGPPGVGSDEWAANMSRDPQVVLSHK